MTKSYREPYQILLNCYHIADNNSIKWLLLKRSPNRGGFWQGITGATLKNESLKEAARREMLEESSISLKDIIETNIQYNITIKSFWANRYNFHPDQKFITEYVFIAQLSTADTPILSDEHTEWGWYTLNQTVSMLKWPKNIDALKRCHAIIQNNSNSI